MGKLSILTRIFGKSKGSHPTYNFCCPREHPNSKVDIGFKMGVNINEDVFNCFVCGYHGKANSLIKESGDYCDYRDYPDESFFYNSIDIKDAIAKLPNDCISYREHAETYEYLLGRGFNEEILDFYDVKYSKTNNIILSSYDKSNILNFWTSNYPEKKNSKYVNGKNYSFILGDYIGLENNNIIINENNIDFRMPLYIFEGYYDFYSMYPYTNVTASLGKTIKKRLREEIIKNKTPFIISFDYNDKNAQLNAENFVNEMEEYNVLGIKFPYKYNKDINEDLKKQNYDNIKKFKKESITELFRVIRKFSIEYRKSRTSLY